MTDPENFLDRWSRKKREAAAAQETPPATPPATPKAAADAAPPVGAPDQGDKPAPSAPATPKPEFDLASLPSLESITATTDIRGFFASGVPPELTRAALRRAWSVDPAIRDFVGLQENDWDFNAPDGIPGFGELPADFDIKKLVAQIFDEPVREREPATDAPTPCEPQAAAVTEESTPAPQPIGAAPSSEMAASRLPAGTAAGNQAPIEQPQAGLVQRENDTAMHNDSDGPRKKPSPRRRHGQALPK